MSLITTYLYIIWYDFWIQMFSVYMKSHWKVTALAMLCELLAKEGWIDYVILGIYITVVSASIAIFNVILFKPLFFLDHSTMRTDEPTMNAKQWINQTFWSSWRKHRHKHLKCFTKCMELTLCHAASSAEVAKYTDCISTEGCDPTTTVEYRTAWQTTKGL